MLTEARLRGVEYVLGNGERFIGAPVDLGKDGGLGLLEVHTASPPDGVCGNVPYHTGGGCTAGRIH